MALGATLHPDAESPLMRACSDKNDKVRMAACKAMAGRKSTAASQMLASIAQSDKNMSVRSAAIRSLGTYQTDEARAILRKSLDEKSPVLQHESMIALKSMTGKDFGLDGPSWRKFLDGEAIEEPVTTLADRIQSSLLLK
jgi:HEAT repeat protein